MSFSPNLSVTTFTAPSDPAVLTFNLTVTDSLGMASLTPDDVVITVVNQPPQAEAGVDQSVNTDAIVMLNGSDSDDPEGDYPLVYHWEQSSGAQVTLSDPGAVMPTFTAPSDPSVLVFMLTVTDSLGLADPMPGEMVVTVNNQSPLADAGPDQSVNTNAIVTLDGSESSDPDGDYPLSYLWEQSGGPAVALDDPNAVMPTFTAPSDPTVLSFILTVTDSLGLADPSPDEVVVTVNNQSPVADAGADQSVDRGTIVVLDGSASNDPDDDYPLNYLWEQTGGPAVALSDPNAIRPRFTAPTNPELLTFMLTVTDSLGLADPTPDEVMIMVGNQPPTAVAGIDQEANTDAMVILDGSGSYDPDDDYPLSYLWEQIAGPLVTLSDPAVLVFTLVVTDNLELRAITPDEVVITINNRPPEANAGADRHVQTDSTVMLDGSGSSDPDGDYPLNYLWTQTGGPIVNLNDSTSVMPVFNAPSLPAVLTFTLVVMDSLGLESPIPDEIIVTVEIVAGYQTYLPLAQR